MAPTPLFYVTILAALCIKGLNSTNSSHRRLISSQDWLHWLFTTTVKLPRFLFLVFFQCLFCFSHNGAAGYADFHVTFWVRCKYFTSYHITFTWGNYGTTAKQVEMVLACVAKRLGEEMYGVWSGVCQIKRKTKENLDRDCAKRLSVLWRCWFGGRKGIRPVKYWVVGFWRGYLSGSRCRFAYGPADASATHYSLAPVNPDWFYLPGFTFPVQAHLGSLGQSPGEEGER